MRNRETTSITLHGQTGKLLDNLTRYFLLDMRETNPAILTMFRDRDRLPHRELNPWSGEFAGKYLTGAAYVYRVTHNDALREYVAGVIEELLRYQDTDGYLGCFAKDCHLTGKQFSAQEEMGTSWDSWNHYHLMTGLLLWYDITGTAAYFTAVERMAALFMERFYGTGPSMLSMGAPEMNLSVYHAFVCLYHRTADKAYLSFARKVERDINDSGDYMRFALDGHDFYQNSNPRWESLHTIMGYLEMYRVTGERHYLDVVQQIVYSILKTDVHNTGAFSTDERAIGTPFQPGSIETCCVVAFNALVVDLYRQTKDIRLAEFLEIAHYNAVLGSCSPSGRWSTYTTPMDGERRANTESIGWQSRPGSPWLNCCSVNAPRGVATLGQWNVMEDKRTVYVNTYEPAAVRLTDGSRLVISGDFPAPGVVTLAFEEVCGPHTVALRIPAWSANATIRVGDEEYTAPGGRYFRFNLKTAATVTVSPDFSVWTAVGSGACAGKYCVYAGPVLFGLENTDNPHRRFDDPLPPAAVEEADIRPARCPDGSICLRLRDGTVLKDFYHLGQEGGRYRTWLPTEGGTSQ